MESTTCRKVVLPDYWRTRQKDPLILERCGHKDLGRPAPSPEDDSHGSINWSEKCFTSHLISATANIYKISSKKVQKVSLEEPVTKLFLWQEKLERPENCYLNWRVLRFNIKHKFTRWLVVVRHQPSKNLWISANSSSFYKKKFFPKNHRWLWCERELVQFYWSVHIRSPENCKPPPTTKLLLQQIIRTKTQATDDSNKQSLMYLKDQLRFRVQCSWQLHIAYLSRCS